MTENLIAGTATIALTVLIHTFGVFFTTQVSNWLAARLHLFPRIKPLIAMVIVVFCLFLVMSVEVWLWAFAFLVTGAIADFDEALYFSTVTFSTLGYGDILAHEEWRLFAALEGTAGFLMIGWSTAYLVAASMRVGPFQPGRHF